MKRVLVLGGYGGFGGRLSRRLASHGFQVLVTGRSLAKAKAFCAEVPGTAPLVADRNGFLAPILAQQRPDLVIDAAGPFQNSGFRVPLACLQAGIPYLDLADARDFVCGIKTLDVEARSRAVPIISGASSVPALSGAVARRLAEGLETIASVEIAISASNRATAGTSVAAAILSYVGRPLRLWRGKRWQTVWGWQDARRETFRGGDAPTLGPRWVAVADVPDLELLPASLPGRPATTFRAGTDSALQTLGLWLLSWPIRWLDTGRLRQAAPVLRHLQRLTAWGNGDSSAMSVTVVGAAGAKVLRRRWTLIAERGDGPELPTLAATLLAEKILNGEIASGAQDAGTLLMLDEFAPLFAGLAVRHEVVEEPLPPPLYARVMGPAFEKLPPAVRAMHQVHGDAGAEGEAEVTRGKHPAARLLAWLIGFPPAGRCGVHVSFTERDGVETWTRAFGGTSFSSRLRQAGGRLEESFGPFSFRFDLPCDERGLAMRLTGWRILGLPLPLALAPRSLAREWQESDRFCFDVPITLPLIGLVVHYRGWLRPVR